MNAIKDCQIENKVDDSGNPTGGEVTGKGLTIYWQDGPLGRGAERQTPPLHIGSLGWKRYIVERSVKIGDHEKNTSYNAGDVGTFVIQRTSDGWNYFWIEPANNMQMAAIDWAQIERDHIACK